MKRNKNLWKIIIITAASLVSGCSDGEVPDICGYYEGTRAGNFFAIDITECNEDGIKGVAVSVSGEKKVTASFEGGWDSSGSHTKISFEDETVISSHSYYSKAHKCSGHFSGDTINGVCKREYYSDQYYTVTMASPSINETE